MMYYDKKEVGHWKVMYSVVRDLEALKTVKYFSTCTHMHNNVCSCSI